MCESIEGGLRLKGVFKTNYERKRLITIITVVYNGIDFLENTIKSVKEQSYDNVEYIIVDGGSTDGTVDLIRQYEHEIDYWVSEQDKGIYDAMNKGIELGRGNWINFMNAGDCFFDAGVLEHIFKNPHELEDIDVIFGDHEVIYPKKVKTVKAGRVENLWKGSQFSHQSAFINLNHHKKNKFNMHMKISADFDFFYNTQMSGSKILYMPQVISKISSGGISDTKRIDSILEWWSIIEKTPMVNLRYSFLVFWEVIKGLIKAKVKWVSKYFI